MNETPTTRVWTDDDGDTLTVHRGFLQAALVSAPDSALLTSAQCREVAAHLTALADRHDHKETPMTEHPTPADPRHDPRPWQDCIRADIREGDLVETLIRGLMRIGVAHRQDENGDWYTKGGQPLTAGDHWPLRRIPAHTTEKETTMPENTTPAEPVTNQAVAPGPRERVTNEIDEWLEIETREGGYSYLHMGCGHTMNLDPETRAALVAYLTRAETGSVLAEPLGRTLLAVPEGHGAPHHDAGRIKPDDIVLQVDHNGDVRAGRAHHQDEEGDWMTEAHMLITWASRCADRPDAITVWPALTPPAVEVEMPSEHPAHLLDVEDEDGNVFAYMALDRYGYWVGVDQDGELRVRGAHRLPAFTLPDGTRARRDGDRPDGTPRFVKVREEA